MEPRLDSATRFRIALAAAAALYAELAVIRFLPGQVRVLGYFTNYVLLGAFLGLGLGGLLVRRVASDWPAWLAPLALVGLLGVADLGARLRVIPSAAEFLFLEYQSTGPQLNLYVFLALTHVMVTAAFVPLGFQVGRAMAGNAPLERYVWNLVGSLVGVASFAFINATSIPAWAWLTVAVALSLAAQVGAPMALRVAGLVCVPAVALWAAWATQGVIWSPYQKLSLAPLRVHPVVGLVQEWDFHSMPPAEQAKCALLPLEEGFVLRVNDDSYQTPLDLSDAAVARHPSLAALKSQYEAPFRFTGKARKVAILGAGAGNDVAGALRAGMEDVDAVEIDREIAARGIAGHPEHPYADPRVHLHIQDARAYLAHTQETYDLIVFGLVDSHVLTSSRSNVRLDSYIFTEESFSLARAHLRPGGLLVVNHAVGHPWFMARMAATLEAAFGKPPMTPTENAKAEVGMLYVAGDSLPPSAPLNYEGATLRDDWPFPYLDSPRVPMDYLLAAGWVLLSAIFLVRVVGGRSGFNLHFAALGAGFLLVETRALSVISLLAGSTWQVSAAVFAAVMVMALASVGLARIWMKLQAPAWPAYVGLLALLALNYSVDTSMLLELSQGVALLVGTLMAAAPVLMSGVIFSTGLARDGDTPSVMASNLVGAVAGGLAEYTSMASGFRYLVILAMAFYLLAFLTSFKKAGGTQS